jgi:hypothetical protein
LFVNIIEIKQIKLLIIFSLLLVSSANSQQTNNLSLFTQLVDSSLVKIKSTIPDSIKNINLQFSPSSFDVFNSEVIDGLINEGYKLNSDNNSYKIQYIVKVAAVNYGDIFRAGILGDFFTPRTILFSGNFNSFGRLISSHEFNYSFIDTVKFDDVKNLENPAYPFTQGKLPSEPFFSGLLEPVVIVGSAALAVILFFTIRSK